MTDLNDIAFDDVDDDEEGVTNAFSPMRFDTTARRVKDLLSDYRSSDLDPRPSFQRGYVWDKSRASRLVESILLNVPLPLIYTAEEIDQTEVVIDGQQRLLSIFGFIEGKFPKDDYPFRLSGLKLMKELNGKTFIDLDEPERRALHKYMFQVIRISNESHADVKFEIFERLNSGSVTLNAQELRNCVYRGSFNTVLRQLADTPDFRKLIGGSGVSNRMQDVELVLRFLAFYERTYLKYSPGMKSFLNSFMDEYRNLGEGKASDFGDAFRKSCSLSYSVFGSHAFRKFRVGSRSNPSGGWEGQINRPLFDIVMWGFTRFEKPVVMRHSDAIRSAMINLLTEDTTFVDSISSATGDRTKTQFRFELWYETLREIIEDSSKARNFPSAIRRRLYETSSMCSICQQGIHSLDDAHVDHILPFSKGGTTTLENAQLTHRYCNLAKSNRS